MLFGHGVEFEGVHCATTTVTPGAMPRPEICTRPLAKIPVVTPVSWCDPEEVTISTP